MAEIPRWTRRGNFWLFFAAATAICGAVPTACANSADTSAATAGAMYAATAAVKAAIFAATAAATTFMWASSLRPEVAGVESFSFDSSSFSSSSSTSSSTSSSSPGGGSTPTDSGNGSSRQQRDRASCQPSDDPDYTCLLPHPLGSFEGEVKVYLSAEEELLSVKVVVLRASLSGGIDGGGGWASLGFSPNGKMAGPSEAVVGFVAAENGVGGPSVLRYRMDGYSTSSVMPLPDSHQVLTSQAVDTAADGSLVIKFKRSFAASFPPLLEGACVPTVVSLETMEMGGGGAEEEEEEEEEGRRAEGGEREEGQGEEGDALHTKISIQSNESRVSYFPANQAGRLRMIVFVSTQVSCTPVARSTIGSHGNPMRYLTGQN